MQTEAVAAFEQLGGKFAVMKAQVHAGGRVVRLVALKLQNLKKMLSGLQTISLVLVL